MNPSIKLVLMLAVLALAGCEATAPTQANQAADGYEFPPEVGASESERADHLSRRLAGLTLETDAIVDATLTQTLDGVLPEAAMQLTNALQRQLTQDEVEGVRDALDVAISAVFTREVLIDDFASTFRDRLDVDQMVELLSLYESPLGSRVLLVQGDLMERGVSLPGRILESRGDEFMAVFNDELEGVFREAQRQ